VDKPSLIKVMERLAAPCGVVVHDQLVTVWMVKLQVFADDVVDRATDAWLTDHPGEFPSADIMVTEVKAAVARKAADLTARKAQTAPHRAGRLWPAAIREAQSWAETQDFDGDTDAKAAAIHAYATRRHAELTKGLK